MTGFLIALIPIAIGLGVFFWAIASAEELPTDRQAENLQWSLDND